MISISVIEAISVIFHRSDMGHLMLFVRIRACSMDFDAGRINSAAVDIGSGRRQLMAPFVLIRCNLGHHLLPSL